MDILSLETHEKIKQSNLNAQQTAAATVLIGAIPLIRTYCEIHDKSINDLTADDIINMVTNH